MRPGYFLKKAISGMRNAVFVNLLASLTITLSLILVGVFLIGFINANRLADRLGGRLEVAAYLKDGISGDSLSSIEDKIRKFPEVRAIKYISKEEALASFKKELAGDSSILDGLAENPLPASIQIKLKADFQNFGGIKGVVKKLKGMEAIEELQYGGEWLERFSVLIAVIKIGSAAFGGVLILSMMLIVSNTIRLTIQTRMDEIEVMRLVGATPLFIKAPFLVEGILLGFAGAVFATATMAAVKWVIWYNYGAELRLLFGAGVDLFPYQAVSGLFLFGVIFGLLGSIVSLWRFPKA